MIRDAEKKLSTHLDNVKVLYDTSEFNFIELSIKKYFDQPTLISKYYKSLVEEANYSGEAIPLVVFQGQNTKIYIGFDNFRVITKYNQSSYYALVIHQLAVELKKKYEKDS